MSEAWTSLLAGVVGAIVGGAASLAGTMVVNKRQMATNARMRMYDELLPRLERALHDHTHSFLTDSFLDAITRDQASLSDILSAVRRAGAIAGRQERRAGHNLALLWSEYVSVTAIHIPSSLLAIDELGPLGESGEESTSEDKPQPESYAVRYVKAEALLNEMWREIRALSDHLGAKLG